MILRINKTKYRSNLAGQAAFLETGPGDVLGHDPSVIVVGGKRVGREVAGRWIQVREGEWLVVGRWLDKRREMKRQV